MEKKKMQSVNFKTIDEFLGFLPEEELKLTEILREIILDCIPNCTEKLSYNVPYYSSHKKICFLWPGAVFWGGKRAYEGVRLGFINGNLMHDDINYLEKGGRKQVYYKTFASMEEVDEDILRAYFYDAVLIDEASVP